jgi:high-affinity Fe2+/Pb2+ permease
MKNDKANWSTISYITAFLIGVILFWSFGRDWLNFKSPLIFLAGLIGIAVAVLLFGVWNLFHHSSHK